VTKKDESGWWEGEINDTFGYFPCAYVAIILHISKQKVLVSDPSAVAGARTGSSDTLGSPSLRAVEQPLNLLASDEPDDWSDEAVLASMAEESDVTPRSDTTTSAINHHQANEELVLLKRLLAAERESRQKLETMVLQMQTMLERDREMHKKLEEQTSSLKDEVRSVKKQLHKQSKEAKASTPRGEQSGADMALVRKTEFTQVQAECASLRTEVDTLRSKVESLESELVELRATVGSSSAATAAVAPSPSRSSVMVPRVPLPLTSLPPPMVCSHYAAGALAPHKHAHMNLTRMRSPTACDTGCVTSTSRRSRRRATKQVGANECSSFGQGRCNVASYDVEGCATASATRHDHHYRHGWCSGPTHFDGAAGVATSCAAASLTITASNSRTGRSVDATAAPDAAIAATDATASAIACVASHTPGTNASVSGGGRSTSRQCTAKCPTSTYRLDRFTIASSTTRPSQGRTAVTLFHSTYLYLSSSARLSPTIPQL